MTNRELLELAALAAWIDHAGVVDDGATILKNGGRDFDRYWNPLEEDGDAFRLMVKLGIRLSLLKDLVHGMYAEAVIRPHEQFVEWEDKHESLEAAARLAIVRCAAEIGRRMKEQQ